MTRLAVDIGGTFTDAVLEHGGVHTGAKVLTTPADPADGFMAAAQAVLSAAGVAPSAVSLVLHGTTLATNAIIERKGAKTALVVTAGHRDSLEIAWENRFAQYDLTMERRPPLAPRDLRLPVTERLNFRGEVLTPLDDASVQALVPVLREAGVESIAIGLLHAYANPAHEWRVAEILGAALPDVSITLSSEVCPEIREYERQSTACANAYVRPLMARYLDGIESRLQAAGFAAPCLLMTSGGNLITLETAARFPVRLIESGPAGGAILAAHIARELDEDRVVSFDMGGTTAKICLIDGGAPLLSRSFEVDRAHRFMKGSGMPVKIPVVEMVEIGAGGGSIAAVDALGRIQVGPQSAGADPGPACYGLGGTHPTVTDANLALGRIAAEGFAGGTMMLDAGAADAALAAHVGRPLASRQGGAAGNASPTPSQPSPETSSIAARARRPADGYSAPAGEGSVGAGRTTKSPSPLKGGGPHPEEGRRPVSKDGEGGDARLLDLGKGYSPDALAAAEGVIEIVDENMAAATRVHAVERGAEASGRTMIAFGGAAPLHAARLAGKLGIDRVIVPENAGVGSAVGMLLAPIAYEVVRSRYMRVSDFDAAAAEALFRGMHDEAEAVVRLGAKDARLEAARHAWCRYVGQGHEIKVALPDGEFGPDAGAALRDAFAAEYEHQYGRTVPDLDIEVLTWSLNLSAPPPREGLGRGSSPALDSDAAGSASPTPSQPSPARAGEGSVGAGRAIRSPSPLTGGGVGEGGDARFAASYEENPSGTQVQPIGTRPIHFPGAGAAVDAALYDRAALPAGVSLAGPAAVGEAQSTSIVPEGFRAHRNRRGDLVLERSAAGAGAATTASAVRDQVIWDRLIAIVEEQAQALIRTAFSTTVREAGDLSAGVFDLSGRMLAQAVTGTPGHVNAMAASVGFFLEKYPYQTMQEGDVYLTNDPWHGTGHLFDFTVVTPAFRGGAPVALFASTVHVVDIGGSGFGPDAGQVYEEGLCVPILPLFRSGAPDEAVLEIVRANVREPVQVVGDLYSLAACNAVGGRRLIELMDELGLNDVEGIGERIIETSRAAMIAKIAELPAGTYHNEMTVDGYDRPVTYRARMEITDDAISVDFAGTSGMSAFGINSPITYTQAYTSFGIRCVVGGAIPNNAGSLGTIRVTAPEGSILNAPRPAAVNIRHVTGQMLPDVVLGCLEQARPGIAPAEGASSLWNPMLSGGRGITGDQDYGDATPFSVTIFHCGGTGGRPGKDGLSATSFPSGVRNTPVEITESVAPLIFRRKELRPASGGAGRWRGGDGQVIEIAHAEGAPFAVFALFDRIDHPARGRDGGADGAPGAIHLASGGTLRGKGKQIIPAGDAVVLELPGGGGLGKAG
jgi:N-methylhydantoinase A/oxoprolinase/acetone carboxylase beta subunit/N-methylhydantoinase B/oxoprolinase/acetone carboxylase alpha subunit